MYELECVFCWYRNASGASTLRVYQRFTGAPDETIEIWVRRRAAGVCLTCIRVTVVFSPSRLSRVPGSESATPMSNIAVLQLSPRTHTGHETGQPCDEHFVRR
jgi:hypothetical protein